MAPKAIPSSDANPYERESSEPAISGKHCLYGVSTPHAVEGADMSTKTDLQRDAAQPAHPPSLHNFQNAKAL